MHKPMKAGSLTIHSRPWLKRSSDSPLSRSAIAAPGNTQTASLLLLFCLTDSETATGAVSIFYKEYFCNTFATCFTIHSRTPAARKRDIGINAELWRGAVMESQDHIDIRRQAEPDVLKLPGVTGADTGPKMEPL
jgi:hypothetical protein